MGDRAVYPLYILDVQSVERMRCSLHEIDRVETGLVRLLLGAMAAFLGSTH